MKKYKMVLSCDNREHTIYVQADSEKESYVKGAEKIRRINPHGELKIIQRSRIIHLV